MAELISILEYARRRGCSDVAVHKAIKAGKIVRGIIREPGSKRPKIDPKIADAEWSSNFDPAYKRNEKLAESLGQSEDTPKDTGAGGSAAMLSKAKAKKEVFRAQLAELEYKEKLGQLVDKDAVFAELFQAGQGLRTELLSIPDRVIDDLMACANRQEAHAKLYKAISDALTRLADIDGLKFSKK